MGKGDLAERMWAEALATLERAERLQRQFFLPAQAASGRSCWAPPTDVFESANEFVVLIALPGISADRIEVDFDAQILTIKGERRFPAALAGTAGEGEASGEAAATTVAAASGAVTAGGDDEAGDGMENLTQQVGGGRERGNSGVEQLQDLCCAAISVHCSHTAAR